MKKSIFLFFAAILCAIGMNAADITSDGNARLYFNVSAINWWVADNGNQNFAYFYGPSGNKWSSHSVKSSGSIYYVVIPKGTWNGVILTRNNTTTSPSWDNKWNQTGDITLSNTSNYISKFSEGSTSVTWGTAVKPTSTASVSANPTTIFVGGSVNLTAELTSNANINTVKSVTYSTTTGASVSGNTFTATAEGEYTVTATVTYHPNGYASLTSTASSTVTITVEAPQATTYTITTAAENGTVTGAGVYEEGTNVTLTATPNAGYQFKNWTVAGAEVSTDNPYTFAAEEDVTVTANFEELPKVTVYFVNNEGWDEVNAYAWNKPSGVNNNGWPGVAATKTEEKVAGFDVYSFTAIAGQYTNVIFNGGGSQTADLVWNADKYYYVGAAADYAGGTKDEVAAALAALVTYDYYVVGTVNNWILKDAAFGMTDENADGVYEKEVTLTSGKNQLKINNGTWDNANTFGYDQLVATYEGVEKGSDSDYNNIIITLAAEKTITVKFDKNKKTITLEGLTELVKETLTYTVTVPAGTKECYLVGLGDWNTFRPMTLAGKDKFTLTVENVYKKDEYKYTASKDWNHVEVLDQNDTDHGNRTWEENDEVVKWKGIKLLSYFEVSVNLNNPEWGAVAGNAGEYLEGEQANLIATPAEGYEFVNWTVGGKEVSTEASYSFTVTADVALVANFVAVNYKDITFTVGKSGFTGVPQIKWWGAKGLEDAAEPVEMTAGQYSRYSYTFSNIDAITGVSFYIVLDGVQSKTITLHETPNTYSQFYTILQEVFVTLDGEAEGVQLEGHPMAGHSRDYTKVNGVVQLPANTTKAFKLTVDGKDKGGNTIALTKDNLTANFTEDGEGNATIATELAGGYLFTYDYITKDVTVVYPFVGTMDLGQMTPSYSDESVTLKDDNNNEVTIYNVVEGEHTYGENFDIEASVKHNGEWYTLTGKGTWTLADGVMTLVTTNLVDENNTVNYTITATALAPQEYTIVCDGTYDEEVTEHYSSIKYAATTDEEDVIVIEIGVYGEETSASGQFNDNLFTTLTYTVAEGEDGVKVLTATATDEAGNTYHITITATKLVYPSINIYNAKLVADEDGDVSLTCTYEGVNLTLNYYYAMWTGEYTAELASEDVYYSCEAPSLEKEGSHYTITGVFVDDSDETKYNVMVTTKANPATALDNLNTSVAPVKMIENGQLIIVKDGVQYNAQGAILK